MEEEDNGPAGQSMDLYVGLRVSWDQTLDVLRRWQVGDHSLGRTRFNADRKRSRSHTKVYKCQFCDFPVKFAKEKAKQPGGADAAECVHMSEKHEAECQARAMQDRTVHGVRQEVIEVLPTGAEAGVLGIAGMGADSRKRPHLYTPPSVRANRFVQDDMYTATRTAPMDFLTQPYPTSQPSFTTFQPQPSLGTPSAFPPDPSQAEWSHYSSHNTQGQGDLLMPGPSRQQPWASAPHHGAVMSSHPGSSAMGRLHGFSVLPQELPDIRVAIDVFDLRRPPNHVKAFKDDAMLYERYRGPGLGYSMRGVGVNMERPDGEDSGISVLVRTSLMPGTGEVIIDHNEESSFVNLVRLAVSWAMVFEKCLAEAGFEIVNSLRSLKYNIVVDATEALITGESIGVVVALNLLQSMTNCTFDDEVIATGALHLDGCVTRVAGIKAKVLCAGRVAGSKAFMLPQRNVPAAQRVVQDNKLNLKLRPVSSMIDAIPAVVRKPKLRLRLLDVVKEGGSTAALNLNVVRVTAIGTENSAYAIIVAAIPGSGKVHITGLRPHPDRPKKKLMGAIAIGQALGWVRNGNCRSEGLHQHILDLMPAGVCQGLMVDLVGMRVTSLHPEASDYLPNGQLDAAIPSNSIDIHVHIRNDNYGLASDNAYINSAVVLALASLVTGIKPNSKVSLHGECRRDGRMHGDGNISPASLRFVGRYYGITTALLSIRDAETLKETAPEVFLPTFDGPKVKPVAWIHECVREAFREPE